MKTSKTEKDGSCVVLFKCGSMSDLREGPYDRTVEERRKRITERRGGKEIKKWG